MKSIILHTTAEDEPYLGMLKALLQGRGKFYLDNTIPATAMEYVLKAKGKGASIASTSPLLLQKLLPDVVKPKLDDYSGSLITYKDVEFLFVPPLEQLVTVPPGKFIFDRYMSKFLSPENFIPEPPFRWELFEPGNGQLEWFSSCDMIAVDIETLRGDPDKSIICVGFCGGKLDAGQLTLRTVVVPFDSRYNVAFVRSALRLPQPKIFQNGKYDIAYLFRCGCPVSNYALDTLNLFHSWYCELPKDLAFINAFMLRNYIFHKDEGKTGDKYDLYKYNAKDCYTTFLSCLGILLECPPYALANYLLEFPVVFPCILAEHTGIKWDEVEGLKQKFKVEKELEEGKRRLQVLTNCPSFNPASAQQTVRLFAVLGSKDVTTTTPKGRDKVANRHPLNARILWEIESFRKNAKLQSSYFKEGVVWNGRVFYALNPSGTDTGRLSSRESQFRCGLQIQNIPRGGSGDGIKKCFVSDPGFYLGEADYAQAESKGTAYLSGDIGLIKAVDDESKYFHGTNASKFFGLPYEQITNSYYDLEQEEWVHEKLNKIIIDIAKRVNHGANYNMGEQVLLETMGIKFVLQAKQLLRLSSYLTPLGVCSRLLQIFSETYPVLKGDWYRKCIQDVQAGYLIGPTGWTRRCFGDPQRNKRHLNSYVAHPPQSLNAMLLNQAFVRVFNKIYLPEPQNFKLHCQVHDSIIFSYKKDREDLAWKVKECMHLPTEVTDTFGVKRIMTVNVELKGGAERWSDLKLLKKVKR